MGRTYVGLATTVHDPALAIVDEEGKVVFAEAAERFLQCKRAWNVQAEFPSRVADILKTWADPRAPAVVATTWSRSWRGLIDVDNMAKRFLPIELRPKPGAVLTAADRLRLRADWLGLLMGRAQAGAGETLQHVLQMEFGNHDVIHKRFPHHLTHAMMGCAGSPFDEAACLVVDGFGELGSVTAFRYEEERLRQVARSARPVSDGSTHASRSCVDLTHRRVRSGRRWGSRPVASPIPSYSIE